MFGWRAFQFGGIQASEFTLYPPAIILARGLPVQQSPITEAHNAPGRADQADLSEEEPADCPSEGDH
ncbi:hypothetical protein PoB_003080600 [Plakobranchus ocellatus]|uniref:Uncharacterized protein n=1 Tax=Plakobranchus ocellatus TaxID=259542 RepID=A0AAV3ZZ95_9GAST|nr:hypothetical protein PoB_003080600 [Plakobranchus ocellatus]